ncbi:MAG: hypothetical protein PVI91_11390 [Gammaproteobacteria bacterium]|jgi:hypothetical protein
MAIEALTLRGQRRRAAGLAAAALAQSQAADLHRRRLGEAVEARVATKESLMIGFVAGMSFGTLTQRRGRRAQDRGGRPVLLRNSLLRQGLRMAGTYAISHLVELIRDAGTT